MQYHKVVDKRFFSIALDDILVDGKSTGFCKNANPPCKAAPDSGSTTFGVPEGFKKIIDKMIPERDCNQDQFRDTTRKLTFVINKVNYDLEYNHFIRRVGTDANDIGKGKCGPSMMPMHFDKYPGLDNLFILGDSFMSTYYTVFDRDHDQVGFATAKHTQNEQIVLREPDKTGYIVDAKTGKPEKRINLP